MKTSTEILLNRDTIERAVDASNIKAFGFTPHMHAADWSSVTYSSLTYETAITVKIDNYNNVTATLRIMHTGSLIISEIRDISFPHPAFTSFLSKMEKLCYAWRHV